MYVQWLLEFVWRIFIQGPLLIINFFTTNGNINKILENVGFVPTESNSLNSIINISVVISIIISFAAILITCIFIFKLFKVVASREIIIKYQLIEIVKELFKIIVLTFIFSIFFGVIFILFDTLFTLLNEAGEKIINQVGVNETSSIEKIPSILYYIISGVEYTNNENFLFPNNFLESANSMNFLFSIILVLVFSFSLIYIIWSIFQKMIEIIFLYITLPITFATGFESQKINWKIWTKEIFNKIALIFVLAILLRLYLYLFYSIYTNIIIKIWGEKDHNINLYLSLFVVLALSGSSFFVSRMFSIKYKENIGIFNTISSINQTKDFIIKNSQTLESNLNNKIHLEPINSNIDSLRKQISKNTFNFIEYKNIKKIKVFNK